MVILLMIKINSPPPIIISPQKKTVKRCWAADEEKEFSTRRQLSHSSLYQQSQPLILAILQPVLEVPPEGGISNYFQWIMQCAAKRATRLKIFSIPSLSLITSPRPPAQKGKSSRTKEIPIRCILPEATFSPKARGACFGPLSTGFKCNLVGIGKGKVISHTKGWNS